MRRRIAAALLAALLLTGCAPAAEPAAGKQNRRESRLTWP